LDSVQGEDGDRLRDALLEGTVLNDVQKRVVQDYQRSVGGELADIVVKLGFLTEEQVKGLQARSSLLTVKNAVVSRCFLEKVPLRLLRGYRVIPVEHGGATLLAAEDRDIEPIVLEEIWELLGVQLPVVAATPGTVMETLDALSRKTGLCPALPEVSLSDLVALLVKKGVLSAEELREHAAAAPAPAPRCER
jgi:hypothetical protein